MLRSSASCSSEGIDARVWEMAKITLFSGASIRNPPARKTPTVAVADAHRFRGEGDEGDDRGGAHHRQLEDIARGQAREGDRAVRADECAVHVAHLIGEVLLGAAHLDVLDRGERLVHRLDLFRLLVVDGLRGSRDEVLRNALVADDHDGEVRRGCGRDAQVRDREDHAHERDREDVADGVEALDHRHPEDQRQRDLQGAYELVAVALEVHLVGRAQVRTHQAVQHLGLFREREGRRPAEDPDGSEALHDVHAHRDHREDQREVLGRRVPEEVARERDAAARRLHVRRGEELHQRDQRDEGEGLEQGEEQHRPARDEQPYLGRPIEQGVQAPEERDHRTVTRRAREASAAHRTLNCPSVVSR